MQLAASIVIPTYNHAKWLREAISCALAQTVPCEVIVVDDGSTDETPEILASSFGPAVQTVRTEHLGPSAARNLGKTMARGEFVMFLDADDLIAPTKVERQLAAFRPEIGWVLCDVRIEDEARDRARNASEQYDYPGKDLGGWIHEKLADGNFIPVMSPLVRRSVLERVRFDDLKVPEDWHFWRDVAALARVAYVPEVLATYRHRKTGRSRLPKKSRSVTPNIEHPLRLDLGCGTPGTRSWHPAPGFVNLDKSLGWRFEDGLGDFARGSVAGITISHTLMYVREDDWSYVFSEFARVLAPGGVVRITEDDACSPASSRYGGWKGSEPAITMTAADMVARALEHAGLVPKVVDAKTSHYVDSSLCQAQHGTPPDVFFVEGVRVSSVLFAPHNDDEALFAAFTILRHRPHVVVCFESVRDYGDPRVREQESREACDQLGATAFSQWAVTADEDLEARMRELDAREHPARVWAPDPRTSHKDHAAVAAAARAIFGDRVTTYHTYDKDGKVRNGFQVPHEKHWTREKLRALARYQSQLEHPRANHFFMADLHEYHGTR